MVHQKGGSSQSNPSGSALNVPISKRLVSFQFTTTQRIQLVEEMLADRGEQQAAKGLELDDALKLVELLDLILKTGGLDASIQPTCVRYLARVCGWHRLLPNSVLISGYECEPPHDGGGHSKISIGGFNGQKVVVKMLNVYESDSPARKRERAEGFCKEVVVWKNLNHPNILPFVGAMMVTEPGREKYEIVSELMENGDINTFIRQNEGVNRFELLKDVAVGLKYLHSQLVIHGDLKGLNILINKHRRACLADFGLTRITAEFTSTSLDKSRGTLVWMSPEVWWPERFGYKTAKPTKESDIYSLGTVIYEVICGHRPFHDLNDTFVMEKLQKGELPARPKAGFTDSLWKTLKSCWKLKRKERPSIDTVLKRLDEASKA